MKILVLASFSESLVKFRGSLLQSLVRRGITVHVAAPELSMDTKTSIQLKEIGCFCHDIFLRRNGTNPFVDLVTLIQIGILISRLKIDHVLAYTIKPVVYGMIAARFLNVKGRWALITGLGFGFTVKDSKERRFSKQIPEKLYRVALKYSEKVIFQNPDDRQFFIDKDIVAPKNAVIVNGSGVPLDVFQEQRISLGEDRNFLLVARLLKDKGIYEYIDAARLVRKRYPKARFHLVGWLDSNPSSIAKKDLEEWCAEGIISYHGRLDDVRAILGDCHVFVLPSYREGTPRSVLEAMAIGRAIITTDVPGCRETVIDGYNGFLVPAADSIALAEAMVQFLEDDQKIILMGKASRQIVEAKYDVDNVNAAMRLYMGILD